MSAIVGVINSIVSAMKGAIPSRMALTFAESAIKNAGRRVASTGGRKMSCLAGRKTVER
jgi:hypothetical protein